MVCHVALPPQTMIDDAVAWDEDAGVFIIKMDVANDDIPPAPPQSIGAGLGLVRVPPARTWLFGVSPEDADALMRGLAGWGALFLVGARLFRWI